MISLSQKIKRKNSKNSNASCERVSIRQHLLVKEVQEMEQSLPPTCSVNFEDSNILYDFMVLITPDEGFWKGGHYNFHVFVPEEYNMVVGIRKHMFQ